MTLTEFLLARIAEREAKARALLRDLEAQIEEEDLGPDERGPFTPARMLSAQLWAHYDGQTRRRSFARGQQIATLADPGRVLVECEAKRLIVALHKPESGQHPDFCGHDLRELPCPTLRALALPYADHPDYLPEWKP
jgi:hypothetical protein